jgi:pSer/pThr/pTyr-binding forkhead associated (FHA) protein
VTKSPLAAHSATPRELKRRFEAERAGTPFLVYRDGGGHQHIHSLTDGARVMIGRDAGVDVVVDWDDRVSGAHAQLEHIGRGWALTDDGLSLNGSFVNGARVSGRRRLRDGDTIRVGDTLIAYRAPEADDSDQRTTVASTSAPIKAELTAAQRRVLIVLCRPFAEPDTLGMAATNQQIADELVLSVDAVKAHLRALFVKFGLEALPQNRKRVRLAQIALQTGAVSERDL